MRRSLLFLLVLCMALIPLGGIRDASAEIFQSTSMTLSTHQASTVADHELEFVTRDGLTTSDHTLIITYESGFDLTSVTFGDIDLAYNSGSDCDAGTWTDIPLQASPDIDNWGVSISGQVMTFVHETIPIATIPANRCVQVQVGTNAVINANQIVNPGSAGSYEIDVARGQGSGDNDDHNMLAVAIASISGTTVSATVSSGSSTVTPPSTPIGDTAAPTVSSIVVSSITDSSAVVSWLTDEAASSVLSYGETTSYELGNVSDSLFRTVHTETLSGLNGATEHHIQISATDSTGNTGTSADVTFTTLDLLGPQITNIVVTDITETSATVTWDTDELSDSTVTTPDGSIVVTDSEMVMTHIIELTGLDPATVYPISVISVDAVGNSSEAASSFTTLEDLPPTNVSGLAVAPGPAQVALSWINPTDPDYAGIIIVRSTVAPPTSLTEGDVVFSGDDTSFVDAGLTPGDTYFYTLFVVDTAGNLSSGASITAIPDPVPGDLDGDGIPDGDGAPEDDGDDDDDDGDGDGDDGDAGDDDGVPGDLDGDGIPDGVPGDLDGDGIPDDDDLPPTTVDDSELIPSNDVQFQVARDTITLTPTSGSSLRVLAARPMSVVLNMRNVVVSNVARVELQLGSSTYLMNPTSALVTDSVDDLVEVIDDRSYVASVLTPTSGTNLGVIIYYLDGEIQTLAYDLVVTSGGVVLSGDSTIPLEEANVSLYQRSGDWVLFNAPAYAQGNPILTAGGFAWYVPNAAYRVEVMSEGFVTLTSSSVAVGDNIFTTVVELIPLIPSIEEDLAELEAFLSSDASATEKAAAVARLATRRAVQSVKIIRQDPTVKASATVAAPATAVIAATTATTLAVSFNGFRFLQYLFTAPFLFFKRRKRKEWGLVYDSLRKVPVDLAIVRLRDKASNRIVKSHVTDRAGRYLFIVDPGSYKIEVSKPGFIFPSGHLKSQKRDGEYLDLYHGEEIVVTHRQASIAANIPLDPVGAGKEVTPRKVMITRWLRVSQYVVSVLGVVVAVAVAILQPSIWTIFVLFLQVVVLLAFVRLAKPRKPTGWGIVYDDKTHRPLAHAIVRIFDPKYNKLLETQITDSRGRYAFLVGPSEYYATYQKPSYNSVEVRPIDRTDTKEPSYISLNVGMEPNARVKGETKNKKDSK